MKIEIIIVTYNGMQWIEKCLKSILNSSKPVGIIIVDNNSTDGTVSYIRSLYPRVIVLEQKSNLGFGQANNLGISYALNNGCDYVFLLNQDAYLEVDTIGRIIEVHKENLEYGVLSPIHLNGVGNKLDKNFCSYLGYDSNNYFYHDAIKEQLKPIYSVPFVNAAAWLIPVSTLYKIGGFDPLFFHYGEDVNYCQRLEYHNLKIGVVTNAFVFHDRENIDKRQVLNYHDKLKKVAVAYKIKWGNINQDTSNLMKQREKSLFKKIISSTLKLKFILAKQYWLDYQLIREIKNKIIKSREFNTIKGGHYLK